MLARSNLKLERPLESEIEIEEYHIDGVFMQDYESSIERCATAANLEVAFRVKQS